MKKILFTILFLIAGLTFTVKSQTNDPFSVIKSQTISATTIFDTVTLSPGYKTLSITNNTTGILSVAFDNTYGNKDTANVTTIAVGQEVLFTQRKSTRFYTKSTMAGNISVIEYLGYGEGVIKMPVFSSSGSGSLVVTEENQTVLKLGSDTLNGTIDTLSFSAFSEWVQGSVTFDASVDISTSASFTTYSTLASNVIFGLEKTSVSSYPRLYIRRNAGSGTVNYSYSFGGK